MSLSDLPSPQTTRWVASRKALVVKAVSCGLITEDDACEMYNLSSEELDSWKTAIKTHGMKALKTTTLQTYRQTTHKNETFASR